MKRKMLYIMNVNWGWIAQRPHFIAEELEKYFDITVVFPESIKANRKTIQSNTHKPNKCFSFLYTYRLEHNKFGRSILRKLFFHNVPGRINDYDFVWISTPLFIEYLPDDYKGIVLADFMDDYFALTEDSMKEIVREREKKLFEKADLIFVSSHHLLNYVNSYSNNTLYVPNAVNGAATHEIYPIKEKTLYKLGYVGTISEWMNWELISKCLKKINNIEFHFWGPVTGKDIPNNSRIIFHGVVEHEHIYAEIKEIDCLIMPFQLNEITYAVDPVKLYEYISFGKCIISIMYPEVERFADFIWGYKSDREFIYLVSKLTSGNLQAKYNRKQQEKFIVENTWENRVKNLVKNIPISK